MKKYFCYGKKGFCTSFECDRGVDCAHYDGSGGEYRDAPMTNADRIRSMTEEELGIWICKHALSCGCCVYFELCCRDDEIANGAIKWLQQPAEEADHV